VPTVDSGGVKPQSFEYRAPASVLEALDLLAEHGDEASVLAGGQSLVPMLNLRLARPALLVDINRLPGLAEIEVGPDTVRLGALVRHRAVQRPPDSGPLGRLLARVAPRVGHPPIRNRGTVCGSLAHADPAAEWSLVGLAAGAEVGLASVGGTRRLSVDALLDGAFATHRRPEELIVDVTFPRWAPGRIGAGFVERARTAGSFAEYAACVVVRVEDERVAAATVAAAGLGGGRPVLLPAAGALLVGQPLTARQRDLAAERAAAEVVPRLDADPPDYQRAIVGVLVADALDQAAAEVGPGWTSG